MAWPGNALRIDCRGAPVLWPTHWRHASAVPGDRSQLTNNVTTTRAALTWLAMSAGCPAAAIASDNPTSRNPTYKPSMGNDFQVAGVFTTGREQTNVPPWPRSAQVGSSLTWRWSPGGLAPVRPRSWRQLSIFVYFRRAPSPGRPDSTARDVAGRPDYELALPSQSCRGLVLVCHEAESRAFDGASLTSRQPAA
jgi:hypothetical protein